MSGDDDEKICHFAVNKKFAIREITKECSDLVNEKLDDQQRNSSNSTSIVRKFIIPELNIQAKLYHQLSSL